MNGTAAIIGAIATVLTAIGGIVLAVSKLAPVIDALNKMFADQHKRTKELRKLDTDKKADGAPPTPKSPLTKRYRYRVVGSAIVFAAAWILLFCVPFFEANTSLTIAMSVTLGVTIVCTFVSVVATVLLVVIRSIQASQLEYNRLVSALAAKYLNADDNSDLLNNPYFYGRFLRPGATASIRERFPVF